MSRKAKMEETVVTEENAILENAPAEIGTLMEGDSPAKSETLMNDETSINEDFPIEGELPSTDSTELNKELPASDETAMEDDIPTFGSGIMDVDIPKETSPSRENMNMEAETGIDNEVGVQPEDMGEASVEGDEETNANINTPKPALKLSSESGAEASSNTGNNAPEVPASPRKRKTK